MFDIFKKIYRHQKYAVFGKRNSLVDKNLETMFLFFLVQKQSKKC